jgi:hypothetical protein
MVFNATFQLYRGGRVSLAEKTRVLHRHAASH